MDEELNVFAIYAVQCAVIGLFCTMLAYVANWIDSNIENMKGLKRFMQSHIHFHPNIHFPDIKRKAR